MKISIITVCYNSDKTIQSTIKSVLEQSYKNIEYILIDGKSTDNTVKIIEENAKKYPDIIKWKSEPDNGIYDAMNKGIKLATGDLIGILNSDDYYLSKDIIEIIVKTIIEKKLDSCYGDLLYIKNNKPYRYWKSGKYKSFKLGWMPPHPAFFVKKEIYEKYGLFRLDCGVNADYELMLRFLEIYKISTVWINNIIVCMNAGGISNSGIKSRIDAIKNDRIAWKVNNLKPYLFTNIFKIIIKIPQFINAIFVKI